jgi:hypothetical protein
MGFDLSGRERALRRGAGAVIFQPPAAHLSTIGWHLIDCGEAGMRVLQWRPGIYRWMYPDGITSMTAENAGKSDWVYVGYHGPALAGSAP